MFYCMKKIIYMDCAATKPMYDEVIGEIAKVQKENFGNPSSMHSVGEKAFEIITRAREKLAKEIGAKTHEIIFTSSGTESNNLALRGLIDLNSEKKKIIISSIEHPSVIETCSYLRKRGFNILEIPVDKGGIIDFNFLEKNVDKNTLLISVMHVNNEIGTIQDLEKIGGICRKKNVYFHTDAIQSFGKLKIDVNKMKIDLLSTSAHKIGGPKGIGFLYIREEIKISPIIFGGGQERGLRSGTENVSGIVGFAKAIEVISKINKNRILENRDYFIDELKKIGGKINGSIKNRIYNNVNVAFFGISGEQGVIYLSQKGIMASTGSACSSKKIIESKTLREIGLGKKEIDGSLRFSIDEKIGKKEIDFTIKILRNFVQQTFK